MKSFEYNDVVYVGEASAVLYRVQGMAVGSEETDYFIRALEDGGVFRYPSEALTFVSHVDGVEPPGYMPGKVDQETHDDATTEANSGDAGAADGESGSAVESSSGSDGAGTADTADAVLGTDGEATTVDAANRSDADTGANGDDGSSTGGVGTNTDGTSDAGTPPAVDSGDASNGLA